MYVLLPHHDMIIPIYALVIMFKSPHAAAMQIFCVIPPPSLFNSLSACLLQ